MGAVPFLRVVDMADLRGAMCGRILADLGADVIKVESAGLDPRVRDTTPYRFRNANRRCAVVDFDTADGTSALDELLSNADVFIENFPRGEAPPTCLALDDLHEQYPRLIRVALRDFGLSGPRADWHLEPLCALAASGTMHATGFAHMAPVGVPGFLAHDCASIHGAVGALAALRVRDAVGGQTIEVSVQEAALAGTNPWSIAIRDYLRTNPRLNALGGRFADASYWVLPAADGWMRTVIGSARQWDGFVAVLGHPDALMTEEWSNPGFRLQNVDVVRIVAAERLADRTREQLLTEAAAAFATMGILHTPREFVAHPQTVGRRFFTTTDFPGLEGAPFAATPFRLSATPPTLRGPAPDGTATDARFDQAPAAPPTVPRAAVALPLEGIRVVEFGMAAVVPEMCGVLSELGAEVIKVESMAHPDVLRTATNRDLDQAFTFNAESRGRASVAIDVSYAEGRDLARRLCATADIVAENNRGGALDRLGLGYHDLRIDNPALIYASSQGYGRGGPFGEMPAYGPLNNGFAGLHFLWSDRNAPYPCATSLNHPDHIVGKLLAVAVLAALAHRDRTGEGQHIDMAQTEAAAYLMGEVYLDSHRTGDDLAVCGNESPTAVPHGVYRTAGEDQWMALSVPDDAAWARTVTALGLADEPDLRHGDGRLARRDTIDTTLAALFLERDGAALAAHLQDHGVSAMPVMGPEDHHADQHLAAREFIVTLQHLAVGVEHHVGNPMRMSVSPQRIAASAPCLGADTEEVFARLLGIEADEVGELRERGVCC